MICHLQSQVLNQEYGLEVLVECDYLKSDSRLYLLVSVVSFDRETENGPEDVHFLGFTLFNLFIQQETESLFRGTGVGTFYS